MKRTLILVLMAVLLSACMGGGNTVIQDVFYQLPPAATQQQLDKPLIRQLIVRSLRSDGLRRERAMLYSEDKQDIAIQRFAYQFWSDTPSRMIERYMVEHLRQSGLAHNVQHEETGLRGDYLLAGRLLNFEQIRVEGAATEVQVSLQLQLLPETAAGKTLIKTYPLRLKTEHESMHAITLAFAAALDQILNTFCQDVAAQLAH